MSLKVYRTAGVAVDINLYWFVIQVGLNFIGPMRYETISEPMSMPDGTYTILNGFFAYPLHCAVVRIP